MNERDWSELEVSVSKSVRHNGMILSHEMPNYPVYMSISWCDLKDILEDLKAARSERDALKARVEKLRGALNQIKCDVGMVGGEPLGIKETYKRMTRIVYNRCYAALSEDDAENGGEA